MTSLERIALSLAAVCMAGVCTPAGATVQPTAVSDVPSAAVIVQRNAAARGGAEAWHKVETMAWAGHVEGSGPTGRRLTFTLEQKRPNRTRFEIAGEGPKSVRIYDGSSGWKMRAGANGKPEVLPYSQEELTFARGAQVIDGPLMDYAAKGGAFTVLGVDTVDGARAYVLDVKLPSGGLHRVWVDATTFLEVRHDREVRAASGQVGLSTVFYRNYRSVEGLQIPMTIETGMVSGRATSKLVIDRVAINPQLDDTMFAKPASPTVRRAGVTIDTRSAAAPASLQRATSPP